MVDPPSVPVVTNARRPAIPRDSTLEASNGNTATPTRVRRNAPSYQSGLGVSSGACTLTPLLLGGSPNRLARIAWNRATDHTVPFWRLCGDGGEQAGGHAGAEGVAKATDRCWSRRTSSLPSEAGERKHLVRAVWIPPEMADSVARPNLDRDGSFFSKSLLLKTIRRRYLGWSGSSRKAAHCVRPLPQLQSMLSESPVSPRIAVGRLPTQETPRGQRGFGILEPTVGRGKRIASAVARETAARPTSVPGSRGQTLSRAGAARPRIAEREGAHVPGQGRQHSTTDRPTPSAATAPTRQARR